VDGSLLEPQPVDPMAPVDPLDPVPLDPVARTDPVTRTEPVACTAVARTGPVARTAVPVQSCRICHTLFETTTGDAHGDRLCSKSCRRIATRRADRPGRGAGRSA